MNPALIIGAAILIYFGMKSGGNPLAALAASVGVSVPSATPGDTILPNGQPANMTADQWGTWVANEIDKLVGPKVGSYQKGAPDRAWFAQCIAARQLLDRPGFASQEWTAAQACGAGQKPTGVLAASLTTGKITGIASAGVSGAEAIGSAITGTAASAGGGIISGAVASAIPIIGSIVSAVTFGLNIIGQHHAQAVAKENSYLCQLIPAANQALADIDTQFRSGQISSAQATQQLDDLVANFETNLAPVVSGGAKFSLSYGLGGQCNLGCLYSLALAMIRDARELDYVGAAA